MKRIALALVLALSLSGCAQFKQTIDRVQAGIEVAVSASVTPKQAVVAMQSYDVVAITATNYMRLRRCDGTNAPICRDPALRSKIDAAILSGRVARNNLKAYLKANPGISSIRLADYGVLTRATDTLIEATAVYRAAIGK